MPRSRSGVGRGRTRPSCCRTTWCSAPGAGTDQRPALEPLAEPTSTWGSGRHRRRPVPRDQTDRQIADAPQRTRARPPTRVDPLLVVDRDHQRSVCREQTQYRTERPPRRHAPGSAAHPAGSRAEARPRARRAAARRAAAPSARRRARAGPPVRRTRLRLGVDRSARQHRRARAHARARTPTNRLADSRRPSEDQCRGSGGERARKPSMAPISASRPTTAGDAPSRAVVRPHKARRCACVAGRRSSRFTRRRDGEPSLRRDAQAASLQTNSCPPGDRTPRPGPPRAASRPPPATGASHE